MSEPAPGSAEALALEVEALVREAAWRATKLCELTSHDTGPDLTHDASAQLSTACETAKLMLYRRRLRDHLLPGILFEEPAWDILLSLFVAQEEGRLMSVADLRVATGLVEGTATRTLRSLEAAGHVHGVTDADMAAIPKPILSASAIAAIRAVLEASLRP